MHVADVDFSYIPYSFKNYLIRIYNYISHYWRSLPKTTYDDILGSEQSMSEDIQKISLSRVEYTRTLQIYPERGRRDNLFTKAARKFEQESLPHAGEVLLTAAED